MLKTIVYTVTVEINTDRRPRSVSGLQPEFGGLFVYEFSLDAGMGYLDAPECLPAGSCYKSGRSRSDSVYVYDSVTSSRFWW